MEDTLKITSKCLTKMADHINKYGFEKHGLFHTLFDRVTGKYMEPTDKSLREGSCCILGAYAVQCTEGDKRFEDLTQYNHFATHLYKYISPELAKVLKLKVNSAHNYNDSSKTTKESLIKRLRQAAKRLAKEENLEGVEG